MTAPKSAAYVIVPVSWTYATWEAIAHDVYPFNGTAGAHFVRSHQKELLECGAITRIKRQIVILGDPYYRWLCKRREHAITIPPNAPQHAHKRGRPSQSESPE